MDHDDIKCRATLQRDLIEFHMLTQSWGAERSEPMRTCRNVNFYEEIAHKNQLIRNKGSLKTIKGAVEITCFSSSLYNGRTPFSA